MKRFFSVLLAIILVIVQVPNMGLAAETGSSTDIIITRVETEVDGKDVKIKNNDEFTLTLTLEAKTKEMLTNASVGIDQSSSFKLNKTGSKHSITATDHVDGKEGTVEIDLIYTGGDETQLPITLYYSITADSEILSFTDYVSITRAIPNSSIKEPTPPPKVDESKFVPNISIVSSKTILAESGDTVSVPISIKNTSEYSAYDISSTIELVGDSPIYIDGSGYSSTSRLHDGRTEDLSFKVKVDKLADDKTYPIKVSFQFYNEHGVPFTASDTVYVKVTDTKTSAQVVVNKIDLKPSTEIQPGGVVIVGFELQNKGDSYAKDIKISLGGLKNEGFTLASGLNSQAVPLLEKNGTRYVIFQLKSSNKMTSGSHELDMVLTYKDVKNQEIKDENKFFIPVASNKNQSSNLIIQDITSPTGSIGINKDVDLSFNVRNQGQSDAKNIVITAESADPAGLVPKSVSVIKLDSLSSGEIHKVNYKFLTTKAAETKNYLINIKVEYVDDFSPTDEKYSITQFVGVFVLAPDDDSIKSTPKLIIDKYNFEPGLIRAGENFNMNLSFFNTNSKKSVKNIKIFLTAEPNTGTDANAPTVGSSVFTPVNSSNTFYIDSIPPKGVVQKTITMFTVPDAIAKTHTITANFEYEDSAGEPYTATELIGVPVIQKSKLETGELNYSPESFLGEPIPMSLEFYNTGKVPLYNMMVKLEGDFQTENGSYYIGNFLNGTSEFYEGSIIPSEPGLLEGAVVFTYEDSTGEEQELRKEFSLNVMDAPPMEDFEGELPQDEGKGLLKSKGLWITLILLLAGGGGFFFYKKKKKEKEFALDE